MDWEPSIRVWRKVKYRTSTCLFPKCLNKMLKNKGYPPQGCVASKQTFTWVTMRTPFFGAQVQHSWILILEKIIFRFLSMLRAFRGVPVKKSPRSKINMPTLWSTALVAGEQRCGEAEDHFGEAEDHFGEAEDHFGEEEDHFEAEEEVRTEPLWATARREVP